MYGAAFQSATRNGHTHVVQLLPKQKRFSLGACYSAIEISAFGCHLSNFFAARARVYFDIEMEIPSILTAQAVIILWVYEDTSGGDFRG